MNKTKNINRIANRFAYKFGKLFLIMGAVFAVTEITNAQAQAVEIMCIKYGNIDMSHDHIFQFDTSSSGEYAIHCRSYDGRYCTNSAWNDFGTGFRINQYYRPARTERASFTISTCDTWAMYINGQKIENLSQLRTHVMQESDTDFKARVMRVLPLKELAKMYDPNFVYQ